MVYCVPRNAGTADDTRGKKKTFIWKVSIFLREETNTTGTGSHRADCKGRPCPLLPARGYAVAETMGSSAQTFARPTSDLTHRLAGTLSLRDNQG